MATKKVYPFIHAEMFDLEGNNDRKNVVFDAREVESYESWSSKDDEDEQECVQVNFKSGRKNVSIHGTRSRALPWRQSDYCNRHGAVLSLLARQRGLYSGRGLTL